MPIQVKIKRFDKTLPLPEIKSASAAAFDLVAREDTVIGARSFGYVPLNVAIEVPEGYWTLLVPRSSTHKLGLLPANGIGVIDRDVSGNDDEVLAAFYNVSDQEVKVERGRRISQMVIMYQTGVELTEVDSLESPTRGGFGSTGTH